jgi:tetratricopeptide (TPR) repeat protein
MPSHSNLKQLYQQAEQSLARRDFQSCHQSAMQILQAQPDFAPAFYLMAVIASEHENYAKAIDVVQRALNLDSSNPDFYALLAKCELILNHQDRARKAVDKALSLNLDKATTLDTLGVTLSRLGEHEQAIKLFQRVAELQPMVAEHHYNLAASQQFIGDFDAAEQSLETAIRLKPDYSRAHSSLSQLRKQSQNSNHIDRLRTQFGVADKAEKVDAKLHFGHALAKEYEDLGEAEQSFDWLNRAKQSKLTQIGYDFQTDKNLFTTMSDLLDANNPEASSGSESREPIFIVGMPRTGTTLVERIVSSNPNVFAAGELTNFALLLKRRLNTESPLVLDSETLRQGYSADLSGLGDEYVESTRPRTGHTKHFIDKMPLNVFYVPHILKALPKAKVVCILRNPMDTCLSNYRQLFSTKYPYYNYAYDLESTAKYVVGFNRLAQKLSENMGSNFVTLRYDDLIQDPENRASQLMNSLDLDFDPDYLNFHEKNTTPVSTASSVQVRKPIYSSSVGRWKKYGELLQPAADIFAAAKLDY